MIGEQANQKNDVLCSLSVDDIFTNHYYNRENKSFGGFYLSTKANELLQTYFGYTEFREGQEDIIDKVNQGIDTLGIMPTGGGKSVCYQIPAMMLRGVTIVVSPLISLMKDQVDALDKSGIPSTYINSTITGEEMQQRLAGIYNGDYKLIYVAPERLETPSFLNILDSIHVSLIAIDEAHCISQWGHDFRPSYLSIKHLITRIQPRPTVLALTATATPQVREDICSVLAIEQDDVVLTGFERKNLFFQVVKGQDRDRFIIDYLEKNRDQPGIIYAATRKEVERIHHYLQQKGIKVGKYHGGMQENERTSAQESFLFDHITVMVATNAFGMGINKSNVRFVIHHQIPRNMEAYYQEAGRAGRDGEDSACILLFSPQDIHIQSFLIGQSDMEDARKENEFYKLRQMVAYAHTESCLQQYILEYFGQEHAPTCGKCANCTDDREQIDVTLEAQKVLSCIKRMNERFGKTMIAKVLTGSREKKIRDFRLDQISTYGILKGQPQKDVSDFIDFLTAEGYLRPTDGEFPVLMLTERSKTVLLNQEKVWRKENVTITQIVQDDELFEQLRLVRKEIAEQENVPPYIIFSDATLHEMSGRLPLNNEELLQIKGIGQRKLASYGEPFLTAIQKYVEDHGKERVDTFKTPAPNQQASTSYDKTPSHHITWEMYRDGLTNEEIANQREITERTVENHLIKCADEGMEVNWDSFVPSQYEPLIRDAVQEANTERLTPIKELLPEEVSFFMIRAFLQKQG